MIQAFKRSRMGARLVMLAAVVLAVIIWLRDREYPVFVPIIASALALGIGYFSSRVTGNLLANMENTKYLGYLHMELDPDKFLGVYRDVPGRLKPGSQSEAIYRSYMAKGDYAAAWKLLEAPIPQESPALRGLYSSNQAACALAREDIPAAKAAIAELTEIIDASRMKKVTLADNLSRNLTLHRQHLNCLEGMAVDTDALEDAFSAAQYNIRRLEIARVLAMTALRDGDAAAAKKQLDYLRKNGGKTVFKRWADEKK